MGNTNEAHIKDLIHSVNYFSRLGVIILAFRRFIRDFILVTVNLFFLFWKEKLNHNYCQSLTLFVFCNINFAKRQWTFKSSTTILCCVNGATFVSSFDRFMLVQQARGPAWYSDSSILVYHFWKHASFLSFFTFSPSLLVSIPSPKYQSVTNPLFFQYGFVTSSR